MKIEKRKVMWLVLICLTVQIFCILMMKERTPDTDLYWIASTGRSIWQAKGILAYHPGVIHENLPVIFEQWLFDVGMYLFYGNFGSSALMVYLLVIQTLFLWCAYRFGRAVGRDPFTASVTAMCVLLLFCVTAEATRPGSLSIVLWLFLLGSAEKCRNGTLSEWNLYLHAVLCTVIITNVHMAMWIALVLFLLPYACFDREPTETLGIYLKDWIKRKRAYLISIGLVIVSSFVNPYGWRGFLYLFQSYGAANRADILELRAPVFLSFNGMFLCLMIGGSVFYFLKQKRIDTAHFCLFAGTCVLSAFHNRNFVFLLCGCVPVLSGMLEQSVDTYMSSDKFSRQFSFIIAVCLIVIAGSVVLYPVIDYADEVDCAYTPINAMDYLDDTILDKDHIRLYTTLDNGGYAEWRGYKVYMDARPELYADMNGEKSVLDEYVDMSYFNADEPFDYGAFIQKYQFDYILEPNVTPFGQWLFHDSGLDCLVEGNGYRLYRC